MTTLPERLLIAAEILEGIGGQSALAATVREAATALQPSVGGEVVETMINHARDPHCIGCYVVRWNDGAPVAECNECGATVALLDGLASLAQADGFVLVPVARGHDERVNDDSFRALIHGFRSQIGARRPEDDEPEDQWAWDKATDLLTLLLTAAALRTPAKTEGEAGSA